MKTVEEINERIKDGDAVVVTAAEMTALVKENGAKKAAEEVDVVTTGTFGAMCSSGAFPQLRPQRSTYKNVPHIPEWSGSLLWTGLSGCIPGCNPTKPKAGYRFRIWGIPCN